jgi:hypothetical protein
MQFQVFEENQKSESKNHQIRVYEKLGQNERKNLRTVIVCQNWLFDFLIPMVIYQN